jgi:hypothetical protein
MLSVNNIVLLGGFFVFVELIFVVIPSIAVRNYAFKAVIADNITEGVKDEIDSRHSKICYMQCLILAALITVSFILTVIGLPKLLELYLG